MNAPVRISLLGPVEVAGERGSTPVAGVKMQSLLVMLALAAPHPVSCDRLYEELWGDDQPGNPANALQALASHLRKLLGPETIVRQGTGYALRLDPDLVDATRLERLVREGLTAAEGGETFAAGDSFRAALALVRGPLLGELDEHWFARDAMARLEALILTAREGLIDSELSTGRHTDVVARLVDLVAQHPVRERFRAQLVTALYRSGRQADALRELRAARRYLADELGLEPGPELQALEQAVLAHDPALAPPTSLSPIGPRPSMLPEPLTSFVARDAELDRLEDHLAQCRLTTVVGPAGVGKTRLALQLARRLEERREVWFVELAPIAQASVLAETIATTIGAPERAAADGQPAPTPQQRTVDRLAQRDAVVILDNCEHVAQSAATSVLSLLDGCRNVRIIATSREPLGIDGEHQLVLGPLDDEASTALFVERAHAVQPLLPTGEEITDLCRHLDGLPLAIELAAARTKTLPVPEIADRLRDRFQLLRRTQHVAASHHESLEAAIDWSYELLFDDERRTFRRLAVCAGGVTVEAAERLCGPDALELASRLVDRSLLIADTGGRTVRFSMLESLRAYGLERLAEAGELDTARDDHLTWCIDLAERVEREAQRADQVEWLQRLDDEHDNLRVALEHAVENEPAAALRLIGALIHPWTFRSRRQETRRWAEASLAAGAKSDDLLRARVMASIGLLAEPIAEGPRATETMHGALLLAERRQRDAIAIVAERGDDRDLATCQLLLLSTLNRRASAGEVINEDEADALVAASSAAFDRLGDDFGSAMVRTTDSLLAIARGDLTRAATSVEAAVPFAERSGERLSNGRIDYLLGMLDDLRGQPRSAYRHIERSLQLCDELGMHDAVTAQAGLLALLAERCGEPKLAAQWRRFVDEREHDWTQYDGTVMASARNHQGLQARAGGDLRRAESVHLEALQWYRTMDVPAAVAFTHSCLGFLAAEQGDAGAAADHHSAALAAAADSGDGSMLALTLEGCAATAADPVDAAHLLGAARRLRASAEPSAQTTHRDDVAAITEAARAQLGDAAYDEAEAQGAALAERDAVTLAQQAMTTTGGDGAAAGGRPPIRAGSAARTSPVGR